MMQRSKELVLTMTCLAAFSLLNACSSPLGSLPPVSAASASEYRLQPGDELLVTIQDVAQADRSYIIDSSGTISLPLLQEVKVAGLSVREVENRIAASTDQAERAALESDRSELAIEYNQAQAKEQELLAASQTLERYTSMFQTFVDSLNNQIAAQKTLINKLSIDTEQHIDLYKSLEDLLKTSAQQDVAHQINTIGSRVDSAAEETMAGIGASATI